MKNHIRNVFLFILFLLISYSCISINQTPCSDKTPSTQERQISDFNGIELQVSADVKLSQSSSFKFLMEGPKCDLEKIETELKGSKLIIKSKDGSWNMGKITIHIDMPEIQELSIGGSGSIASSGDISGTDLQLDIAGSGSIMIANLKANRLKSSIAGSGSINIAGSEKMDYHKIDIAGSGDVLAKSIPTSEVEVDIAGSGSCQLNVTNKLKAEIAGSGNVYYLGNPSVSTDITGSGKVKPL
jgi:hypothetical protein